MENKLVKISNELRIELEKMRGTKEEKQAELLERILFTYQSAEREMVLQLISSPENGLVFAQRVNNSIGAVNEVAVLEFQMEPIHIKQLNLTTIEALEAMFDKSIDEILEAISQ